MAPDDEHAVAQGHQPEREPGCGRASDRDHLLQEGERGVHLGQPLVRERELDDRSARVVERVEDSREEEGRGEDGRDRGVALLKKRKGAEQHERPEGSGREDESPLGHPVDNHADQCGKEQVRQELDALQRADRHRRSVRERVHEQREVERVELVAESEHEARPGHAEEVLVRPKRPPTKAIWRARHQNGLSLRGPASPEW